MYEHETSLVPRGSFYGTQYDGLDVYVISARQGTVEDYGAIRFQTSLEPYEVSFETNNNASSLSRGEFKYREKRCCWFQKKPHKALMMSGNTYSMYWLFAISSSSL